MKKSKRNKFLIIALSLILTIGLLWTILNPFKITKEISREYNSEFEKKLIEISENIAPPDGVWYSDEFDGVKIADCINFEAIDYYSNLIDSIKENNGFTGFKLKRACFEYSAKIVPVKYDTSFTTLEEDLTEVNLRISFDAYCGSQCAFWFSHERRVIFNKELEIVKVIGDDEYVQIIAS